MGQVKPERERRCKPRFEDVEGCRNVEELLTFIRVYIEAHGLKGERARRVHWALSRRWKESIGKR